MPSRGHVPDLPGQTRVVRYMGCFGPLARSVDDLEAAKVLEKLLPPCPMPPAMAQ
ncbi:MAG: hypothetical protein ACM3II_06135 [Rhodospirillaceae bacterium]